MPIHFFTVIISVAFTVLLLDCSKRHTSTDSPNIVRIENGARPFRQMMYLNKEHWTWRMSIKVNTLNDTAIIGRVVKIPPKLTGNFWKAECFQDSIPLDYEPYKATRGRLVIEYSSSKYW